MMMTNNKERERHEMNHHNPDDNNDRREAKQDVVVYTVCPSVHPSPMPPQPCMTGQGGLIGGRDGLCCRQVLNDELMRA